jgi:hypothetical protein
MLKTRMWVKLPIVTNRHKEYLGIYIYKMDTESLIEKIVLLHVRAGKKYGYTQNIII